jgi:hypothetical protein
LLQFTLELADGGDAFEPGYVSDPGAVRVQGRVPSAVVFKIQQPRQSLAPVEPDPVGNGIRVDIQQLDNDFIFLSLVLQQYTIKAPQNPGIAFVLANDLPYPGFLPGRKTNGISHVMEVVSIPL